MECPKCNSPMILLLNEYVCNNCNESGIKAKIDKLSIKNGDLLIVKITDPTADEECYDHIEKLFKSVNIDKKVPIMIIPHYVDVQHIKLGNKNG